MRKYRLPRPLHAALCVLAILLMLFFLRLLCGPPIAFSELSAIRREERRNLRPPGEIVARWGYLNNNGLALWDGSEVQTYETHWSNRTTFYGVEQNPIPKPLVYFYDRVTFFRDSREYGWGCPGIITEVRRGDEWRRSLPLLVKNDDSAAVRGSLTVRARLTGEEGAALRYLWRAEAERENPWVFLFFITPPEEGNESLRMLNAIQNGWDGAAAEAEIVWQDESGNELYRQKIDLIMSIE